MKKREAWAIGRRVNGRFTFRRVVFGRALARAECREGERAYVVVSIKVNLRRRA
jgi:hypothetical protein